jgi:hypothetical protein
VAPTERARALRSSPPLPSKRLKLAFYTQASVLPTLVDVDHDGVRDIVGLFWSATSQGAQLYVAAIDGTTTWRAGPYESQWNSSRTHLVVVGDRVEGGADVWIVLRDHHDAVGRSLRRPREPIGSAPSGRDAPFAVLYGTDSREPSWRGSVVVDSDEIHFGGAQTELRDGRLVALYPTKAGPFRLVSRDA